MGKQQPLPRQGTTLAKFHPKVASPTGRWETRRLGSKFVQRVWFPGIKKGSNWYTKFKHWMLVDAISFQRKTHLVTNPPTSHGRYAKPLFQVAKPSSIGGAQAPRPQQVAVCMEVVGTAAWWFKNWKHNSARLVGKATVSLITVESTKL